MGDFSLRNGSVAGGVVGMLAAAFIFLVVPVSLVTLGMHLSDLAIADLSGVDSLLDADMIASFKGEMSAFRDDVILYSIPIIILGFPLGFYPKGNFGRVPFGILQSVTIAMWIWYITRGGVIPINTEIPFELAPGMDVVAKVSIDLVITGFIYLYMMIALAKGGYYFAEYGSKRKKYLLDKKEKAERAERKRSKREEPEDDELEEEEPRGKKSKGKKPKDKKSKGKKSKGKKSKGKKSKGKKKRPRKRDEDWDDV